jgi:hypothetical protein
LSNNSKIFCLTIYPENYKLLSSFGLFPVGLGNLKYNSYFMTDKSGDNISHKNKYYGEYTFHYWLYKNYLDQLSKYKWIGFCTYRRFWIKNNKSNEINTIEKLKENLLVDLSDYDDYDVILTKPIHLGETKILKILKNYGIINSIMDPALLFKFRYNLYDHFKIFHGEFYLKKSIEFLDNEEKKEFLDFLKTNKFNAHNMFVVKNHKILKKFYDKIFNWLFECEKFINLKKLQGYEVRKLGFLAELYLNFYFKKNYKVYECDYVFFDTNKLKK